MKYFGAFSVFLVLVLQLIEGSYFDWSNSKCQSAVTGGYGSGGCNSPLGKQSFGSENEIDHPKYQPLCRNYLTGKGKEAQYPDSIRKPNDVYSGMSSTFDSCHRSNLFSSHQGSDFCREPAHEPIMCFESELSSEKTSFQPIGFSQDDFPAACKGTNAVSKETPPRQSSNTTPSPGSQTSNGTNAPSPYDLQKKITSIKPLNKTTKPYTELLDLTKCGMTKYGPLQLTSYLKYPVVVRRYVFGWPGSKFSITYYGYEEKMERGGALNMWRISNSTYILLMRRLYNNLPTWIPQALKALKYSFIPPENKLIKMATGLERRHEMYQANLHFIYSRTQEQIRRHTFKWPGTTVTITFYGIPKAREKNFPSKVFKALVTSISDARYRLCINDEEF